MTLIVPSSKYGFFFSAILRMRLQTKYTQDYSKVSDNTRFKGRMRVPLSLKLMRMKPKNNVHLQV